MSSNVRDLAVLPSPGSRAVAATARLRADSARAHASTERAPLLAGLARADLSGEDYALAIGKFAWLFRAVTQRVRTVEGGAALLSLTALEDRAAAAEADANALGAPHRNDRLSVGFIHDEASVLGALYVLEGSRAGGALIGSRLLAAGKPLGTLGYRFFDIRGQNVAEGWQSFKTALDERLTAGEQLDRAIRSVRSTFGLIETLFGRT